MDKAIDRHNVYTMPSGVPFLPSLAAGLKAHFGARLDDALILLPTRRAVRQLGDAFVSGKNASLLPRMRPLADIDPEEPPFEPGFLTGLVRPAMPGAQRRFELAKIIARYHARITDLPLDPAGMLALTDPLLAILDDAALEEVSLAGLSKLKDIEDFAAKHFQNAAVLYQIIQEFWPEHVAAQGVMEPMARRVALLNALTDVWTENPPQHPVIIAGSTGTLQASARLMRCVARLESGMIVLPGLDKSLPDESWVQVSAEHPQNSLKTLISVIGIDRADVREWPHAHVANADTAEGYGLDARRRIISESLVPVDATADWPGRIKRLRDGIPSGDIFSDGLKGLSVIEAKTDDEEALVIALMMREALEEKDKQAALVTPDPALARRVKARLRRWNIETDYSQGEPLEETQVGSFLAGLLDLAGEPENPVHLAAMCKHRLCQLGGEVGASRKTWSVLERTHYRGLRPVFDAKPNLIEDLEAALQPLRVGAETRTAPEWATRLTESAECVAVAEAVSGAEKLWQGDAGEKAASLLEELIAHGDALGLMDLTDFAKLLGTLMRGSVVRPRFGTHPRLQILGPLEARMLTADLIILGGLNEGIWPAGPSAQPFLSRGMRQALGLSLPERRYGLAAHDFAELASNPNVVLTRSMRSGDGPRVASRWLWRLKALVKGAQGKDSRFLSSDKPYLAWARALDHVEAHAVQPAQPPKPRPPTDARWPNGRKLSVTQIRTWTRDPYAIYARHILGLRPLEDLDEVLSGREYGSALHNALEAFSKAFPARLPDDAGPKLAKLFEGSLITAGFPEHVLSKERVRLQQAASAVTDWMLERRSDGWSYGGAERKGTFHIPEIDFTLTSKSDLVEKSALGYAAIDYKTGMPSSMKVVQAGFDPQLPLTALMLMRGAFEGVAAGPVSELLYLRIKGAGDDTQAKYIAKPDLKDGWTAEAYAEDALNLLTNLVVNFDNTDTPYLSQPRIQYTDDYGDYDDLARRSEWAQLGDESGPS